MAGDDGGRPTLADDPHVVETRLRQQLRHRLGAAVHLVATGRVGPHRLDAHQVLEVGTHRRQHVTHPLDEIAHADEVRVATAARVR